MLPHGPVPEGGEVFVVFFTCIPAFWSLLPPVTLFFFYSITVQQLQRQGGAVSIRPIDIGAFLTHIAGAQGSDVRNARFPFSESPAGRPSHLDNCWATPVRNRNNCLGYTSKYKGTQRTSPPDTRMP